MRIILEGDKAIAGLWKVFARKKLRRLIAKMDPGETSASRRYDLAGNLAVLVSVSDETRKIKIIAKAGEFIIVCWVGPTTDSYGYQKKYYTLDGMEVQSPAGWNLTDDGLYGFYIPQPGDPDDPYLNDADAVSGGGLDVPMSASGIPAKMVSGKAARLILNQAVEDERSWAYFMDVPGLGYSYNYMIQVDSLTYAPYKQAGNKPWFSRYFKFTDNFGVVQQGVVFVPAKIGDKIEVSPGVYQLFQAVFWSDNFFDAIPKVTRVYRHMLDGTKGNVELIDYLPDDPPYVLDAALIASVQRTSDGSSDVKVVRPKTWDGYGSNMAEPLRDETYDMKALSGSAQSEYHRCADPDSDICYMIDASTISGLSFDGSGFFINTGQSTISNDIRIQYAVTETGKRTYIRMQKDIEFLTHNCGLYVADTLIEESGYQPVFWLFTEDPVGTPGRKQREGFGPILIRQTGYKILHAFHGEDFDAAVYSKVVYDGYDTEILNYVQARPVLGNCRIRKTCIRSTTTFHVAVNGVITDLPYQCKNREYKLTVLSETYSGPALPVSTLTQTHPWHDVGYTAAGVPLVEENRHVTRIFTDASNGKLLVGFDVFEVAQRHDLVFNSGHLRPEYDETIYPWIPASDSRYEYPAARRWMLFNDHGTHLRDVPTPKQSNGSEWQRVNGLALLGA